MKHGLKQALTFFGVTVGFVGMALVSRCLPNADKEVKDNFKKMELRYDVNQDKVLSIQEKYKMYSALGWHDRPANYKPTFQEMREVVEDYEKAQFGIFDEVYFKDLEDSL